MNLTTSTPVPTPTRRKFRGVSPSRVLAASDGSQIALLPAPPSNRGAETNQEPKQALIDYLRFVVREPEHLEAYMRLFGIDPANWTPRNGGFYGYTKSYYYGDIAIFAENNMENSGFCVQIPGQACRQLEASMLDRSCPNLPPDWLGLFRGLTWRNMGFDWPTMPGTVAITRLDVALDDRVGALSIDTIKQHVVDGLYACRGGAAISEGHTPTQERVLLQTSKPRGTDAWGTTVELGRKSSTQMVRCYDKIAEQASKGITVEGHWVRVEYQANAERAQLLCRKLADDGLECVPGIVRSYIEFKDTHGFADTNRYRAPIASWWEAFLEGWHKVRIKLAPKPETVEKKKGWMHRSVAVSMAVIADTQPPSVPMAEFVRDLLTNGRSRYKPKHHVMIDQEKKRHAIRSGALPGLWVNPDGAIVRALPEGATGF